MSKNKIVVRGALPNDLAEVLHLMRQLAEFEGYLDQFKVTIDDLERTSIIQNEFEILVAEVEDEVETKIVGILVFYTLPFTYDLKPWLYIKEIIVAEPNRANGIGGLLMREMATLAANRGVTMIRWQVLKSNMAAMKFYERLGATPEIDWALYSLKEGGLISLAGKAN